jgi:23S rRNA (guanosine2251-2'-O)-methyltransferase
MIAVLDNIRSVHNVGSIFRTADGAGVEKIYCCGTTPTPLDAFGRVRKDFSKVSLGAEHSVAWEYCASTARTLAKIKKEGFSIVAIEQSPKAVSLAKAKLPRGKVCLVFGNEVEGVSPAILKRADRIVEIPMRGKKESLNVSVAFGIAAYHFTPGSRK